MVSVVSYGCEAWDLTGRVIKSLRGWCSKCLVKITGRTHREECVDPSVDLVGIIRKKRLKYVGHVLRREPQYLVRRVIIIKAQAELEGGRSGSSILMDAPMYSSTQELIRMAEDKEGWKVAANALHYKPKQSLIVTSSNECNKNNATHSYNLRSRK